MTDRLTQAIHDLPPAGHGEYGDGHARVTVFKVDVLKVISALRDGAETDPPKDQRLKREHVLRLAHRIGDIAGGEYQVVDPRHHPATCAICCRIADMMIDFFTPDPDPATAKIPKESGPLSPVGDNAVALADRVDRQQTDLEAVRSLLGRAGVVFEEHDRPSYVHDSNYGDLASGITISAIQGAGPKNHGYFAFKTELYFDQAGALLGLGAFE